MTRVDCALKVIASSVTLFQCLYGIYKLLSCYHYGFLLISYLGLSHSVLCIVEYFISSWICFVILTFWLFKSLIVIYFMVEFSVLMLDLISNNLRVWKIFLRLIVPFLHGICMRKFIDRSKIKLIFVVELNWISLGSQASYNMQVISYDKESILFVWANLHIHPVNIQYSLYP